MHFTRLSLATVFAVLYLPVIWLSQMWWLKGFIKKHLCLFLVVIVVIISVKTAAMQAKVKCKNNFGRF